MTKIMTVQNIVNVLERGIAAECLNTLEYIETYTFKHNDADELNKNLRDIVDKNYKVNPELFPDKHATRIWILSALGRLSKTLELPFEQYETWLDPNQEPDVWARYWLLDGIIQGRRAELEDGDSVLYKFGKRAHELEKNVSSDDPVTPIYILIQVLLAVNPKNDDKNTIIDDMEKRIEEHKQNGSMLDLRSNSLEEIRYFIRAFRTIPSMDVVKVIRKLLRENDEYPSQLIYEALTTLQYAEKTPERDYAADEVKRFIQRNQRYATWNSARRRGIEVLGKIGTEDCVLTLLTQLRDTNPSIVKASYESLEAILTVENLVPRIIKSAQNEPELIREFGAAFRWSHEREKVIDNLEQHMLSDQHSDVARQLMSEIGGKRVIQKLQARGQLIQDYQKIMKDAQSDVQSIFAETLKEAQLGSERLYWVDLALYGIGLTLIIVATGYFVISANTFIEQLVSIATGTSLGGGVAYFFRNMIDKPRENMQENIDLLLNKKAVMLAYLRQLYQVDQAYTLQIINDSNLEAAEVKDFSNIISEALDKAIIGLNKPVRQDDEPNAFKTTLNRMTQTTTAAKPSDFDSTVDEAMNARTNSQNGTAPPPRNGNNTNLSQTMPEVITKPDTTGAE